MRIRDREHNWRIVYRTDPDAIIVVAIFAKTTRQTPKKFIDVCKKRLKEYDAD